ncbi:MAG TPA: hypothetical protein P5121_29190, partial [Caldilineaceae bacterium]|nr:hypothetical protein [Caldilineaceae bacterium]
MSCNRCHQFIVTLLLLVGVMAAPSSLHAQSQPTNDQNLITRLDCRRNFPTCALILFDPALPNKVEKENVALSTNRGDLTTLAVERPRQPMRVLFVFDGPQPVRQAGGAGRFKDAVIDLLSWYTSNSNPELLNENQWAAAMIARDAPDDLVSLVDWQQGNYGGFMNVITSNMESLPNGGPPTSAFFEPVQKAVNLFPDGNITNILILFSDGFEIQSSGASANLIQAALKKNVHVYTVLHFAGGGSRAASDMQALAAATGGQFIENAERAQLATLWQALTNEQQPLVATFTMPTDNPTKLTVSLNLPSNRRLTETTDFPAIDVPPLRITSVSVNGQTGERVTIGAEELNLQIALDVTVDGGGEVSNRIKGVEYRFGDERFLDTEEPFTSHTISLQDSNLRDVPRALDIFITDQYTNNVIRFMPININRDLPPTPTPEPTATATPLPEPTATPAVEEEETPVEVAVMVPAEGNPVPATPDAETPAESFMARFIALRTTLGLTWVPEWAFPGTAILLPLLLILIGVALYLRRQQPAQAQPFPMPLPPISIDTNNDSTQPADMDDATNPAIDIFASATLVLERGGAELPSEIALFPIESNGEIKTEWKLGRSGA